MPDTNCRPQKPGMSVRPGLVLVIVLTVVVGIYASCIGGEFVWDDHFLIVGATDVTTPKPIGSYFTTPFWVSNEQTAETRNFYRPLTTLSYVFDYALHGNNPAGFHLTNILIHLANTSLLFLLLRRRGASGMLAGLLVGCWALLPRSTEVVAWVSGRTDALATLAVLGALALWSKAAWSRWAASLVLLLGLFSKELAIAGVFALIVQEVVERQGRPVLTVLKGLVPLLTCTLAYLGMRIAAFGDRLGDVTHLDAATRALSTLEAIGRYGWMLMNPWQPRTQIGLLTVPNYLFVALGVGLIALLMLAVVGRRTRSWMRAHAMSLSLAGVGLGLVVHVIPLPTIVVAADRSIYLPTAACVLVALTPLMNVVRAWRWLIPLGFLLMTFLPVTASRAKTWSDEAAFWSDAANSSDSRNPMPHAGLGALFFRVGLMDRACRHYVAATDRMAVLTNGRDSRYLVEVAGCSVFIDGSNAARSFVVRAARLNPKSPRVLFAVALVQVRLAQFDQAGVLLEQTLLAQPTHTQAANLLTDLPEIERDVMAHGPTLFGLAQGTVEERAQRARLLSKLGRGKEALDAWIEVAALEPSRDVVDEAAEFIVRFGNVEQATAAWELHSRVGGDENRKALAGAYEYKMDVARRVDAHLKPSP